MLEYKVRVGTSHIFRWTAPVPINPLTTPSVSFIAPSTGAVLLGPVSLTKMVAAIQTVSSIAADMRTLTLSGNLPGSADALAGPDAGRAFILSEDDSYFPVTVSRAVPGSTSVVLAEALPRDVTARATSIMWAGHYTQLTAADVTASESRGILWRVSYSPLQVGPAVVGTDTSGIDEGVLSVVRRPFCTGLTTERLKAYFPWTAQVVPHRSQGHQPTIEMAEQLLILKLRGLLRERAKWEDDVDGHTLEMAHAYYTASIIKELQDAELAATLLKRGDQLLDTGMRSIWIDDDGDGVVKAAEQAEQVTGPRATDAGGSFRTSTRTPKFSIGQGH